MKSLTTYLLALTSTGYASTAVFDSFTENRMDLSVSQTLRMQAQEFTVSAPTLIVGGSLFLGRLDRWDGTFETYFFQDIASDPNFPQFVSAGLGTVIGSPVDTGLNYFVGTDRRDVFEVSFTVTTPFLAQPDTSYAFGVDLDDGTDFSGPGWIGESAFSRESWIGTISYANPGDPDFGFRHPRLGEDGGGIRYGLILNGIPVPEPTSLGYLILSSIMLMNRRRR